MICVRPTEFSIAIPLLLPKCVNQIIELTIPHFLSAQRTATKMVLELYTSSCYGKIYYRTIF